MSRPFNFPTKTKRAALARQQNQCGACGVKISKLGNAGRQDHQFGEGADAHHVRPVKSGGTDALDNCVILCSSCHYSAHEGGNYVHGTVIGEVGDFEFFYGPAK